MNKKYRWFVGFGLLIVLAAAYFLLTDRTEVNNAIIVDVTNEVDAHALPDDEWETAVPDMLIFSGGQVRTGADSWAQLALPEGTVNLSTQTIFTVKESVTRKGVFTTVLTLDAGRLWIHTTTDQPHEFRVETGSAVATVRDTRFSVRIDNGETLLSVAEGEATLTSQTESVVVAAGEQSSAKSGNPPAPPIPMSAAERALWATEGELPEMAPPTPLPTPEPAPTLTPASLTGTFADTVIDFDQGSPGWVDFADPSAALGPPDMVVEPPFSGFVNLGIGGHLTVSFVENVIIDEPGPDIRIHGDPDSDEMIIVEVSADGETYRSFGEVPELSDLDLTEVELNQVSVIRIVDDGSTEQMGKSAGAEIDAVEGLHVVQAGVGTAVIAGVDIYCSLIGPGGDLAARRPETLFNVNVQTNDAVRIFVQMPNGSTEEIPQYGDLFGAEKRFHLRIPGLPQSGGTYTFFAVDPDGNPLSGAVAFDLYLGGNEPDPPSNLRGELTESGVLIRWDPSPTIPEAFNPSGDPPYGYYQMVVHGENGTVFGWNDFASLPETAHLIPFNRANFSHGDRGVSLSELEDGVYTVNMDAFSFAPAGSEAKANECSSSNPAEQVQIIIENGEVHIE